MAVYDVCFQIFVNQLDDALCIGRPSGGEINVSGVAMINESGLSYQRTFEMTEGGIQCHWINSSYSSESDCTYGQYVHLLYANR